MLSSCFADVVPRLTRCRPDPDAAIFLPVYDFVSANKLFGYNLVNAAPTTPRQETPLCAYLSLSSYILHHAYRSTRATVYGVLSLITIRIILEDPSLCKSMCSGPLINVRLCRQRPPLIPPTPEPRPPAAQILDIAADTLNHNLRRRLDVDLYLSSLNLIHRLLVCLAQNHIHLSYHWPLLWQSLLSLVRFLTTYAADLQSTANITSIILPLLNTLVLAIATGNAFLPDATAYDDLVYKLVEHSDVLTKFKAAYSVPSPSPSAPSLIDTLIATSKHFHDILEAEKGKGRFRNVLSTKEVSRVIREGYESLEVSEVGSLGVEGFPIWREGEERGLLRKIARMAVDNVREMIGRK